MDLSDMMPTWSDNQKASSKTNIVAKDSSVNADSLQFVRSTIYL